MDTPSPTGKLMITMLGAIAEFERGLLLERQREGVAKAKQEGKYKGRKATARAKAADVIRLDSDGLQRTEIAERLGIGTASVYRVLADARSSVGNRRVTAPRSRVTKKKRAQRWARR
jgi:DNA invertase Pin-like site-specific DNA recombinase